MITVYDIINLAISIIMCVIVYYLGEVFYIAFYHGFILCDKQLIAYTNSCTKITWFRMVDEPCNIEPHLWFLFVWLRVYQIIIYLIYKQIHKLKR